MCENQYNRIAVAWIHARIEPVASHQRPRRLYAEQPGAKHPKRLHSEHQNELWAHHCQLPAKENGAAIHKATVASAAKAPGFWSCRAQPHVRVGIEAPLRPNVEPHQQPAQHVPRLTAPDLGPFLSRSFVSRNRIEVLS